MKEAMSVIIPIGEGDSSWKELLPDLKVLSSKDEIIFSAVEPQPEDFFILIKDSGICSQTCWLNCKTTVKTKNIEKIKKNNRALQLNLGSQAASHNYFWFLHSDSRVTEQAFLKLKRILQQEVNQSEESIYFFNLSFLNDGPQLTKINVLGAWLRSNIFRLPFGDQGFFLHRNIFLKLNGFNERATYGEDHLLIWNAHHKGFSVRGVGASLKTSARRYRVQGWSQTTWRHLLLTYQQAYPELILLLKQKISITKKPTGSSPSTSPGSSRGL